MSILRHPGTILVLVFIVVLLFGANRLPDLARSVGQSLKIFKSEVKDLRDDDATRNTPGTTDAGNPGDQDKPSTQA